jgi:hypothetical protein
MMTEKLIATKARAAIDDAAAESEFRRLYPFDRFPKECCEHACDILSYMLSMAGIRTVQVNGTCASDESWHHVWLRTEDGIIIDITEDQFAGILVDAKDVETVRVGEEGPVQRMFCVNRKEQPNSNFMDPDEYDGFGGLPNVRQKRLREVYDVIRTHYITSEK